MRAGQGFIHIRPILCLALFCIQSMLHAQDLKTGACFTHEAGSVRYCFAADSSTLDPYLGDCYRILLITDPGDGTELARHYLKVNVAADFDYAFIKTYMDVHKLLVIQGAQAFYLYHTETAKLSSYIRPSYEDCAFSDNQGTYISNLKIHSDGSILQLEVKECGTHYFNISDVEDIEEIHEKTNTWLPD